MSKGPGIVERRLRDIFLRDPRGVFTTAMLCQRVYRVTKVQKKHRVSVLRALKRAAARSMPTLWRKVLRHERDDLWFDSRFYEGHAGDRAQATEPRPRKG